MEKYEELKQLLENASVDVDKIAAGNKAAGVRVRKVLQEIIAVSKVFRKEISAKTAKK